VIELTTNDPNTHYIDDRKVPNDDQGTPLAPWGWMPPSHNASLFSPKCLQVALRDDPMMDVPTRYQERHEYLEDGCHP